MAVADGVCAQGRKPEHIARVAERIGRPPRGGAGDSAACGAQRSRVARIEPLSWGEIGRAPKQKEKSSGLNLSNGIIACIIAILC